MKNCKLSLVVCPVCGQINICTVCDKISICPVCQSGSDLSDEIRIELED